MSNELPPPPRLRHPFYDQPPRRQRAIQARVLAAMLGAMGLILSVSLVLKLYALLLLLPLPLQLAASFIDVPGGRAKGTLVYYAPLFIVQRHPDGHLSLHGGTLFDYWFVLRGPMSAEQRRRRVLKDYVEGLIALARAHAGPGSPSFELHATTYFLSPATARRAGFEPMPLSAGSIVLWLNALPLTLSYCLVQRRFRIPPLHRTRTYRASIESLVRNLPRLEALEDRLARAALRHSEESSNGA